MKNLTIAAIAAATIAVPASAMQGGQPSHQPQTERGTITFYDQTNYNGRQWETDDATSRFHWDYYIRSVAIHPGDRWQICARPRFEECIILDRSVPDATMIGIPERARIGSVRAAPEESAAATPRGN
jgi:hypothetical protein